MALICIIFNITSIQNDMHNFSIGAIAMQSLKFLACTVSEFKTTQKSGGEKGKKEKKKERKKGMKNIG